ncbi:MAG TPA: L,D-transpeptidase, partial [Nocardioides sp.]|nr:L,D-transpeptidase [Nocardioides sp.]
GPEGRSAMEAVSQTTRGAGEAVQPRAESPRPQTLQGTPTASDAAAGEPGLPDGSGEGRRVVFSEGQQRVWLVGGNDKVQHTYLVSGSVYDNLDPGSYEVYSRSEQAWGIDDSGTMKYFVRFAQGDNAAIGFHDIPIDDGQPVQTASELGTPLSHGCIRQRRADAKLLWAFAPIGTKVVVTT